MCEIVTVENICSECGGMQGEHGYDGYHDFMPCRNCKATGFAGTVQMTIVEIVKTVIETLEDKRWYGWVSDCWDKGVETNICHIEQLMQQLPKQIVKSLIHKYVWPYIPYIKSEESQIVLELTEDDRQNSVSLAYSLLISRLYYTIVEKL